MHNQKLKNTFQQYIASSDKEEEETLLNQIHEYSNEEILSVMEELYYENPDKELEDIYFQKDHNALLASIYRNEESLNRPAASKRRTIRYVSMAATVLIALTVGLLVFLNKDISSKNDVSLSQRLELNIKPGTDKATLELADGTLLDLNTELKGVFYDKEGVQISKNADGGIVHTNESSYKSQISTHPAYNKIRTPKGGQYQLILADGTKVWLNSFSSLRYPEHFNEEERTVELTGEAYFEVASESDRPFKVTSAKQTVLVLGTHFNVNSYEDEPFTRTSLIEGSVQITENYAQSSVILKPGEEATINQTSQFEVNKVNAQHAVAWKDGFFRFDGASIEQVMRELSRWYNVEIVVKNSVKELRFFGEIYRKGSITEALEMLSYFNLNYSVDQNNNELKISIF